MKSEQARAASEIRKYLKDKGLTFSVKSRSASMMTAVDIVVHNLDPETFKEIDKYCGQYQYGHFDGMQDMYEYSNNRDDIPQAKYVHVDNRFDEDMKQKAWNYLREHYNSAKELPEAYNDLSYNDRLGGEYATIMVNRLLHGSFSDFSENFWTSLKPAEENQEKEPESPQGLTADPGLNCSPLSCSSAHIEEHIHTKRGTQMFIVISDDRVEKPVFLSLLTEAKSIGGWYTKKYKDIPAGFAFASREKAEKFLEKLCPKPDKDPEQCCETSPLNCQELPLNCESLPVNETAAKLREQAKDVKKDINLLYSLPCSGTNAGMAKSINRLSRQKFKERLYKVLKKLADLHECGKVPEILKNFDSKEAIYFKMQSKKKQSRFGRYHAMACTGEPLNSDEVTLALWKLLD